MIKTLRKENELSCNDKTVYKIAKNIIRSFPCISKPVKIFVGYNQTEFDNFLLKDAGFNETEILEEYSKIMCVFFKNPNIYVILVNGENFYKAYNTIHGKIGIIAHELAHCELAENTDIQINVPYGLKETAERMKSNPSSYYKKEITPSLHLANNEYLADALVIGRGFAKELLQANIELADFCGFCPQVLIQPNKIEEFMRLKKDSKYFIRKKDEKPNINGYAKLVQGVNTYCGDIQNSKFSGMGKLLFTSGDLLLFSQNNHW